MYSDLGSPLASPVALSSTRSPSSIAFTPSLEPSPTAFFSGLSTQKLKGIAPSPKISCERATQVPHSKYFLDGDGNVMVTLLVDGRLFRVHRYFLERDSLFFQGLLAVAQDDSSQVVGLRNVTCGQFESLLNFFYDGMYRLSTHGVPSSEWVDLLAVSSTLHFDKARRLAIAAIDNNPLDPVEMIVLAEKYDIRKWLRPAYISLCSRQQALQLSEAEKVGLPTFVRLTQCREEALEEALRQEIHDHQVPTAPSSSSRASSRASTPPPGWGKKPERLDARDIINSRVTRIVDRIFVDNAPLPI